MQEWEYKMADLDAPDSWDLDLEKELCKIGADGWELVTVVPTQMIGSFALFKRPVIKSGMVPA